MRGTALRLLARGWPALLLVVVALTYSPYLRPGGPWVRAPDSVPELVRDEGTVVYDASRITEGAVMYRDFFSFQGPVYYYIHAALYGLTGPSIGAARHLQLWVTATAALLLALLVASTCGPLAGAGCGLIHATLLVALWPFTYPHWLGETFALAGIFCLCSEEATARRQWLAGVFWALSAATIQSVGVPILVTGVGVAGLISWGQRSQPGWYRPALRVLGGAAAVLIPILIFFTAAGALDELVYNMFVWPLDRYDRGQNDARQYANYLGTFLSWHAESDLFTRGLGVSTSYLVAALPAVAFFGGLAGCAVGIVCDLRARRWPRPAFFWGLLPAAAVSPLWLSNVRGDMTHLAFVASFGLVALAILVPRLTPNPWVKRGVTWFFIVSGAIAALNYGGKWARTLETSAKVPPWGEQVRRTFDARVLHDATRAGDTVVARKHAGYIYLFVRPTAISHTYVPLNPEYFTDEQWTGLADEIIERAPAAMTLTTIQWQELVRRRPLLEALYTRGRGAWLRTEPHSDGEQPAGPGP